MPRKWRAELPVQALREAFAYDPETGNLVRKTKKGPFLPGTVAGALNGRGYITVGFDFEQYLAHRIVWALHYDTVPEHLDHINGNGLDNRIENLRECTQTTNNQNMKTRSRKMSSQFKGVTRFNQRGYEYWRARIVVDKREISLGYFKTEQEAKAAYDKAAQERFGEFART